MADNRFRLFRLPFLALRIILGLFTFRDIIRLSLCSKRSLRVAKQCWKKKKAVRTLLSARRTPVIRLYYNEQSSYEFFISRAQNDQQTHDIRFGDTVVPSIHKDTEMVTYWQDKVFGIEQIARHVKALFDEPIHSIILNREEHPNDFIRIIDSIMKVQESIKECILNGQNPTDDFLTHLLDNCRISETLRIERRLSSQFRHNWNIHLDFLHISNSLFFTLQNLTTIDCKYLKLCQSSLTSEDANQFLKHWQNGGSSRIEFLYIFINSLNQGTITSGIDTVEQPQGLRRRYGSTNNARIVMFGGIDIRRNDGTIGTIFIRRNTFQFVINPIED